MRDGITRGGTSALALAGILALATGVASAEEAAASSDATSFTESESRSMQGGMMMGNREEMAQRHAEMQRRVEALEGRIEELEAAPPEAPLTDAESAFHLAGYAFVGLMQSDADLGTFSSAQFNPILHYQFSDLVLFEGELEIRNMADGETEVTLEYSTIDLMLGEHVILVAGKFLSPLGNFRQNLHPAWINKLPSAPVGFGHDGAAPLADIGVQLRGGWTSGSHRFNYATFITNGPELEADGGEIHAIETEGFARDADGAKTIGGRFGYLPVPRA